MVFLSPCSGASIKTCWSLNQHVVALEPELELYEEVLLPLILASEEVDFESRQDPSPTQPRKHSTHFDDEEVEKKVHLSGNVCECNWYMLSCFHVCIFVD